MRRISGSPFLCENVNHFVEISETPFFEFFREVGKIIKLSDVIVRSWMGDGNASRAPIHMCIRLPKESSMLFALNLNGGPMMSRGKIEVLASHIHRLLAVKIGIGEIE